MSEVVEADADRLLSSREVGELLGINGHTWASYVLKGLAPGPDFPDEGKPANLRRPKWRLSTVRAYLEDPRRGRVGRPKGEAA